MTNLIDITEFTSAFLDIRYKVNGISLLAFSYEDVGAKFGTPYVAWRVGDTLIKIIRFSGETFNERNAVLLQVLREIEHHKLVSEGENIVELYDHTPSVNYYRRISENYSSNSSVSASSFHLNFTTGFSLQNDNHKFQGALFIPMEYVQSGTLRDYITVDPLPGIVEKLEVMSVWQCEQQQRGQNHISPAVRINHKDGKGLSKCVKLVLLSRQNMPPSSASSSKTKTGVKRYKMMSIQSPPLDQTCSSNITGV
mmetsp:Transcript_5864/g.5713  ORF Transcript_5864/g.5713 Transcript_5864/m.5713 type:complete len:253 (-) Transcript_5864:1277-2035(-)